MKTHRVLFMSYDGMTDPLGQSQVLPYLFGLKKKGHDITLISNEKKDTFLKGSQKISKLCTENGITWHPVKYRKKPPIVSTILDLREVLNKAEELHKEKPFTLLHCRSYLPAKIGLIFKKKHGVPFLFDMRGFYADERVEGGLWPQRKIIFKLVYRYFKKIESNSLRQSSSIISLTNAGKKLLISEEFGRINDSKIHVIPCCVDINRFDPKKIQKEDLVSVRNELQLEKEDEILGYIGSVGTWYLLPEMMEFFKFHKSHKPRLKFVFITGEDPVIIFNEIQRQGLNPKDFRVQRVDYTEVPKYVSIFDMSIYFIRPSFSKKASSPVKQGELMAMGIPAICNVGVGDSAEIIQKYKAGIAVDLSQSNWQDITWDPKGFDKASIINGANEYYDLNSGIEAYSAVYQSI